MNYKEFVDRICFDIQDALWNEHFKDVLVEAGQVNKLQGEGYYGVTIRQIGSDMGVSMNLNEVFLAYEDGRDYKEIVSKVAEEAVAALDSRPSIQADMLMDYEQVRDKIMIQVVPTEANREMLKGIPHKEHGDISIVYRIILDVSERGESTVLVNNDLLGHYSITEDKLHEDALANAPKSFPSSLRSMKEVMADIMGIPVEMMPDSPEDMFVATCNDGSHGAGCIFYPDFLKDASERLGGDFFVLPSSVHEVLLLADDGNRSYRDLERMVKEINQGEVAPQDRLSDSVYRFDAKKQLLEKAEDYQKRVQDEQKHKSHKSRDDAR